MNDRLVILTFHGIGHPRRPFWPDEEAYWIERPFFEAVLDAVKERSDTLITFDDGNVSDFETALPALLARGMKAHFYIVSDFIGKRGFLSEREIRELHAAGMIVGNHGKSHRPWSRLADQELEDEIVEAKDLLENIISDKIRFAACPNGSYDRRVLAHLRGNGYKRVYNSDRGWTRRGSWLQARNSLLRSDDLEDLKSLLECSTLNWNGLLQVSRRTIKRFR